MNKFLYWTPRILTIVFILFLGLFALDAFEGDQSLIKKLGGFIIHLIPNFVMILILILAWKHEWVGTIAFTLVGIAYIVMFWGRFPAVTYLTIAGPLFLIGILFWLSWLERKKTKAKEKWNVLEGE
jgi:hypothetical protein